jgi:hypothetical protein
LNRAATGTGGAAALLRALGDGGTRVLTPGPHPTYTGPLAARAMEPALGALDAVLELLQSPDRRQPRPRAFLRAAEQFNNCVGEIEHDECSTEQRTRAIRWVGRRTRYAPPVHLRTCASSPEPLCWLARISDTSGCDG